MRNPEKRVPIRSLVKAGGKQHGMHALETIRVSKPARFRSDGEGLILDPAETLVSRRVAIHQSTGGTCERRLRLAQRDPAVTQRTGLHDVTPCHRRRPL